MRPPRARRSGDAARAEDRMMGEPLQRDSSSRLTCRHDLRKSRVTRWGATLTVPTAHGPD